MTLAGTLSVAAQTNVPPGGATGNDLPGLSLWQPFFNVRAGAGYKDNVLLSPFNLGGSGLTFTGLEATLIRLPADGTQFNAFVLAEDTRYWRGGLVDKEQTVVALAQLKRDFMADWQAGLSAQYLYHDEVFDVSSTEQNITTLQAQANAIALRPSLRRELARNWWAELELETTRYEFIAPLDDFWEGGPRVAVGRDYGRKSELSFAWRYRQRAYDSRERVSLVGVTQAGQSLRLHEHEGEAVWRHHWDEAQRWRTMLRLAGAQETDNGEGYFDHWRWLAAGQVVYRTAEWTVRAKARATWLAYDRQPVSAADPTARERVSVSASLRLERRLGRRWKALAEYEHELASSNRPLDGYRANTFLMGLEWEY